MSPQEILSHYELSKTPIRMRVLEILIRNKCALSESDIKDIAGAECDRTTIYRTLKTFEKAQIVYRLAADDGVVKYLLSIDMHADEEHDHLHFRCVECNQLICLVEVPVPEYLLPEGFVGMKNNFVVVGVCKVCSTK